MKNQSNKLPLVWFQGISDPEKKLDFENVLRNSTVALDRLYTIVDMYLDELDDKEMSEIHFADPEWAVREACIIGQKKSLRKIQYLIEGVARPNG